MGCPIRKFSDQSLHTAPRNLSQYITSFVAFQCLGIRHTPLFAWFNAQKIIFLSKLNFYLIVQMNEQSDIDIDIKIYNLKKLKVSNLVEDSGIEPLTSWMQIRRSPSWANPPWKMVGRGRLERPTSPLSGVRSNHLSYRPLCIRATFWRREMRTTTLT